VSIGGGYGPWDDVVSGGAWILVRVWGDGAASGRVVLSVR
jgi:hypothetical protein